MIVLKDPDINFTASCPTFPLIIDVLLPHLISPISSREYHRSRDAPLLEHGAHFWNGRWEKMDPNHPLDKIRWMGPTDLVSPCLPAKLRSIEPDASAAPAPNRHKFVILRSNQLQVI